MVIEILLVTPEADLLRNIRSALDPFGVALHVRSDIATAVELATRRHFGGIIIDCDDLPEGHELLSRLREERSTRSSTFIAILNGQTSPEVAFRLGANFVLDKPVTLEYAQRVLQTAMVPITQNCRQYFRHKVEIPASIITRTGWCSSARIINISTGGLAIELSSPQSLEGAVMITFEIPSIDRFTVEARAEVVWTDLRRAGMRFIFMSPEARHNLDEWLDFLYGREQLSGNQEPA